jgi:putative glutathione S-transferase
LPYLPCFDCRCCFERKPPWRLTPHTQTTPLTQINQPITNQKDFNAFAAHPERDLYPEPLRAAIDETNAWVYESINDGVYRCGFAKAQAPYDAACAALFAAYDKCDALLAARRFIAGGAAPTEADVRLFVTLVRHDDVYASYFKANVKLVRDYAHLREYVRDVYSSYSGAVSRSVDIGHIKTHYWTSHPTLNAYAVVPKGGARWWEEAPDPARAALP